MLSHNILLPLHFGGCTFTARIHRVRFSPSSFQGVIAKSGRSTHTDANMGPCRNRRVSRSCKARAAFTQQSQALFGLPQSTHPVSLPPPLWHRSLRPPRQNFPTRPHVSCRGSESTTALGAAQHQHGHAQGRRNKRILESRSLFRRRRRRRRRPSNLAPACLYVGLFAVTAWLACPAATSAAAEAGAKAAGNPNLVAHVDKAFWVFAENLGRLVTLEGTDPFHQCTVMFYTAWVTNCIGPVPAAGAIQQPLGRAMLATVSSHACYAACSFLAAAFSLSTFPPLSMTPARGVRRDSAGPVSGPKPTPKPMGARNNRQRSGRPSLKLPAPLLPSKRRGPPASTPTGPPVTRIQVRRSARTVPKVWLMAATALGGPAMGAVGAAVSWRAGLVAIPAALSSLSRGSAFSVLVAGTLCYGGAGTTLVARWAVFQGVVGGIFAALLTPSALTVVYMCNYYGRMVTDRRRRGPRPPRGGMKGKGGRGVSGLEAKQEGGDADGKKAETLKEGGSADHQGKIEKDK